MTGDLFLALALTVWTGLWLLRDTGVLGVRRCALQRQLTRPTSRRPDPDADVADPLGGRSRRTAGVRVPVMRSRDRVALFR